MDDVAVALEHVDLLNGLDRLDVELLQRGLELLVVGTGAPVDLLNLPAGCALAAIDPISLMYLMLAILSTVSPSSAVTGCGGVFANSAWCLVRGCQNRRRRGLLTLCTHVSGYGTRK